jgi:hypothetical protein
MCLFTIQAEETAGRLRRAKLPWRLPSLAERKKEIIALFLSGVSLRRKNER